MSSPLVVSCDLVEVLLDLALVCVCVWGGGVVECVCGGGVECVCVCGGECVHVECGVCVCVECVRVVCVWAICVQSQKSKLYQAALMPLSMLIASALVQGNS